MTTLAPLPGRDTEPDDDGGEAAISPSGASTTEMLDRRSEPADPPPTTETLDLTQHRPKPPATDVAGQASWLFGLALALLTEGNAERTVMAEVMAEAAGRSGPIEGAYGRAVALLSEYPGDPLVRRTVDLLAKALLRSRRPARAAEEA